MSRAKRIRSRRAHSRCALFIAATFVASSLAAFSSWAAGSDEAIRLGHDALAAYSAGDRVLAQSLFERAERLAHSPVFVLYLARIATLDGRLESALRHYRELEEAPLDDSAPNAWKSAKSEATLELATFLERYGEVRFLVDRDVSLPFVLEGDAKRTIDSRLGTLVLPREASQFHARDADARSLSIERDERSSRRFLRISLRNLALGTPVRAPGVSRPSPPLEVPPYRPAIYVSFGFTTLFAATGAVLGFVALDQAASVKSGCVDGFCRPGDFALANAAVRNGDLALVSFGLAGASAITGTTLWILSKNTFRAEVSPFGALHIDTTF